MFPKTEKELIIYFKLIELERLYKLSTESNPIYLDEHFRKIMNDRYDKAKEEYFNLLTNINL